MVLKEFPNAVAQSQQYSIVEKTSVILYTYLITMQGQQKSSLSDPNLISPMSPPINLYQ